MENAMQSIKEQLALEYGCGPEDFSGRQNHITASAARPGRRHYLERPFFLQMATFGQNAVIAADPCLHPWLKAYVEKMDGYRLFEHRSLAKIDAKLSQYQKKLWHTHHMFLPKHPTTPQARGDIRIQWYEQADIMPLYEQRRFPNALCENYLPERPDVLAVAAYDAAAPLDQEGHIIGMAGCSADTPLLWQIGIDVDPAYRGRGLGAHLVALLRCEIERRGKIPFYGTGLSNLHSWNIALNCGFAPAWVEIATIEK